ncbi:MAG: DUF4010 domain-containing protein [Planctomycetes bacterium]|nr:DUF4010 domain-containing protein [Planctomycetota bacterium]
MPDATQPLFAQLGISVGLGLLIGLQREHAAAAVAGLRTFPFITVFGTLAAWIDRETAAGGWVLAAGLVGMAAVAAVGKYAELKQDAHDAGLTTVIAMLLAFALGAYIAVGDPVIAVAIGGGAAVLLQFKPELHGLVTRLGADDLRAIMTFVLITCIVLPLLPNKSYGPFAVLNPFQVWLMVVLIVGIGLAGYISYKFLGQGAGLLLCGVLGGAISSTATTASFARRAMSLPDIAPSAAVVVMIASTVLFVRVLAEIAVVTPGHLWNLAPPIGVVLIASAAVSAWSWRGARGGVAEVPKQANPAELRSALLFGALYAAVLLALAAAKEYIPGTGLHLVAILSGLTDMDAITLSVARLVEDGEQGGGIAPDAGWRLILLASMSNLFFKAGIAGFLGGASFFRRAIALFAVPLLVAAGLIVLWP